MPQQSEVNLEESSQLLARPPVKLVVNTGEANNREKGFFVVPDWWASLVPGGFDYCNLKNAPRFALLGRVKKALKPRNNVWASRSTLFGASLPAFSL